MNILDLTELLRQQDIALVGQLLWFPWIRPFLLHCIDVEVVTLLEIHHLHQDTDSMKNDYNITLSLPFKNRA